MKKIAKIICPFVFVLFSFSAFAQDNDDIPPSPPVEETNEDIEENKVFDMSDIIIMPKFPGGLDSLNSFLRFNLVYPDSALVHNIQGKVFIGFIVEKDGSISDIKTVGRKIFGFGLEEESLRVVKMMPKWEPGKQEGKPVRVKFTLPISFKFIK